MTFRWRITLLTAALVFAVTAVTLMSVMELTTGVLRRELGHRLVSLAATTALLIDCEKHAALDKPEAMRTEGYRDIKALLVRIHGANRDLHVKYLYTMVRGDRPGILKFVVDTDEVQGATIGEEFDARPFPEMLEAFDRPVAETDFKKDPKWGLLLSAFAPIRDRSGLAVGIVGADAAVEGLDAMRAGLASRLGLSLFVGLVLAFAAGVYSGRVLARPLATIVSGTDRVRQGDYGARFDVSKPTDFARLSDALNRMIDGLREREQVRSAFARYLSPDVAAKILERPDRPLLEGERRTVTVLFSDVCGFTSLSERMPPEQVLRLLNDYFARMIDILFQHEGTLDKFIGDCMMCLFGAPIVHTDDAERAVRAAIAMQKEVARLGDERARAGQQRIGLAIGVHTGLVVAGNIGSERRMEYSVIGDAVNLASRVQGQAREGQIVLTHATWDLVKDAVECLALDERRVKGREEAVRLYQVLGLRVRSEGGVPERRRHLRGLPAFPARCRAGDDARDAGLVVEVGWGGAAVLSPEPLPGDRLEIELRLDDGGEPIVLCASRATVVELDPVSPAWRFVTRVRFEDVPEATRERIDRAK